MGEEPVQNSHYSAGERSAFGHHNADMKGFWQSHAVRRGLSAAALARMIPYNAAHYFARADSTCNWLEEDDWPLLLPLREVSPEQLVLN